MESLQKGFALKASAFAFFASIASGCNNWNSYNNFTPIGTNLCSFQDCIYDW